MDLSKEKRVSNLLNEAAHCGLRDASLRDVAVDYFTHDSNGVSILGTSKIRAHLIFAIIMYNGQTNSNMLNV